MGDQSFPLHREGLHALAQLLLGPFLQLTGSFATDAELATELGERHSLAVIVHQAIFDDASKMPLREE